MKKVVNSNASVYEIVRTYPEIVPLLGQLGLQRLLSYDELNSEGRTTTIPDVAVKDNLDIETIKRTLFDNNYDFGPK